MHLKSAFAWELEYGTHDPVLKHYNKINGCLLCHMLLSLLFCVWTLTPETLTQRGWHLLCLNVHSWLSVCMFYLWFLQVASVAEVVLMGDHKHFGVVGMNCAKIRPGVCVRKVNGVNFDFTSALKYRNQIFQRNWKTLKREDADTSKQQWSDSTKSFFRESRPLCSYLSWSRGIWHILIKTHLNLEQIFTDTTAM